MVRDASDPTVKCEQRARLAFRESFMLLQEAIGLMHLSPQYARSLILDRGKEDQDYFMYAGKYFVSRDFVAKLKQRNETNGSC
jgi:hypothetical protein